MGLGVFDDYRVGLAVGAPVGDEIGPVAPEALDQHDVGSLESAACFCSNRVDERVWDSETGSACHLSRQTRTSAGARRG
jgi:hypothetical protein